MYISQINCKMHLAAQRKCARTMSQKTATANAAGANFHCSVRAYWCGSFEYPLVGDPRDILILRKFPRNMYGNRFVYVAKGIFKIWLCA